MDGADACDLSTFLTLRSACFSTRQQLRFGTFLHTSTHTSSTPRDPAIPRTPSFN